MLNVSHIWASHPIAYSLPRHLQTSPPTFTGVLRDGKRIRSLNQRIDRHGFSLVHEYRPGYVLLPLKISTKKKPTTPLENRRVSFSGLYRATLFRCVRWKRHPQIIAPLGRLHFSCDTFADVTFIAANWSVVTEATELGCVYRCSK